MTDSQTTEPNSSETAQAWARNYWAPLTFAVAGILVLKYVGKDLAWPTLLLLLAVSFRDGLLTLFDTINRLASKAKTLTLRFSDSALTMDINDASGILEALVTSAVQNLSAEQKNLFLFVVHDAAVKALSLSDGPLKFKLIGPPRSILHEDLRAIRDFNLIRGIPRRRLSENILIDVTPFGMLVQKMTSFGAFDAAAFADYLATANSRASTAMRSAT